MPNDEMGVRLVNNHAGNWAIALLSSNRWQLTQAMCGTQFRCKTGRPGLKPYRALIAAPWLVAMTAPGLILDTVVEAVSQDLKGLQPSVELQSKSRAIWRQLRSMPQQDCGVRELCKGSSH